MKISIEQIIDNAERFSMCEDPIHGLTPEIAEETIDYTVRRWERIYLEEGAEGLMKERRGRASAASGTRKGRPPKLDKKVEEDLIAENQRLRMENEYLKKLNALVQERIRRESGRK